jgi:hypothetical protein
MNGGFLIVEIKMALEWKIVVAAALITTRKACSTFFFDFCNFITRQSPTKNKMLKLSSRPRLQ